VYALSFKMSLTFWLSTIRDVVLLLVVTVYGYLEVLWKCFFPNPPKSLVGETILV